MRQGEAVARILADPGTVGGTTDWPVEVYTLRELVRFSAARCWQSGGAYARLPFRSPKFRRVYSSSCQARRSPPVKLTCSRPTV